jgi:hypothetical protein
VLREDAGFHAYQMLEAGVRQVAIWVETDESRHILIMVARYLEILAVGARIGSSDRLGAAMPCPRSLAFAG